MLKLIKSEYIFFIIISYFYFPLECKIQAKTAGSGNRINITVKPP